MKSSITANGNNLADGAYSSSFGLYTRASLFSSSSFGYNTLADCSSCMATGLWSSAFGEASFVTGAQNTVKGNYSMAMGINNKVNAWYSFSGGHDNIIHNNAMGAFSFGSKNVFNATSYAFGDGLTGNVMGSFIIGFGNTVSEINNNLSVRNAPLFQIGNGVKNAGNSYVTSDAFTVLRNAKTGIDFDNFETNTSDAKLQVNGAIKIGTNGSIDAEGNFQNALPFPCNTNNLGTVKFENDNFYGCKSSGWVLLNN